MVFEGTVDFGAVARVARRVDVKDVRLTELSVSGVKRASGVLCPDIRHETSVTSTDGLQVGCLYHFLVKAGSDVVAKIRARYEITYSVVGGEPLSDVDLEQFAAANGVYHSWPFVRELVFGLTARIGFPPYSLPVFKFSPKPPPRERLTPPTPGQAKDTVPDANA